MGSEGAIAVWREGKGDRVLWVLKERSLFDVEGKGDRVLRGDRAQLFTPSPVLHKHPQDDKSSLDMKNYAV